MGANNGSGQPYFFMCHGCRRIKGSLGYSDKGSRLAVKLTGRKRYANRGGNAGGRNSTHAREYKCSDCGHIGWSRHIDLEDKERHEASVAST